MPYKEIETSQNKSFSHNPIINSLLLITLKSREGSRTDFKWNPSCKLKVVKTSWRTTHQKLLNYCVAIRGRYSFIPQKANEFWKFSYKDFL